jgi:hypothetical protein
MMILPQKEGGFSPLSSPTNRRVLAGAENSNKSSKTFSNRRASKNFASCQGPGFSRAGKDVLKKPALAAGLFLFPKIRRFGIGILSEKCEHSRDDILHYLNRLRASLSGSG